MKLLDRKIDNTIVISTEALAIESFKNIWDRDKTKTKDRAIKELAFIYFYCDYKSPYNSYDDDEKLKVLSDELFGGNFSIDPLIAKGIESYRKTQETFSMKFLQSAKKAAKELINFFENVDLNERTDKNLPVYKPSDITNALSQSVKVIEALDRWEEKVKAELDLKDSKIKGGGQVGYFED